MLQKHPSFPIDSAYEISVIRSFYKCLIYYRKGDLLLNNQSKWLPIIASVGMGAATYYTMTKNNQNIGQTVQKFAPFLSDSGGNNGKSGQMGPFGMS